MAEEEGIRYASLRRAKKALGVESERPDFVAPWRWRLATDAETEERPATENQAS